MSYRYHPAEIEAKWQAAWEEQGLYKTEEDPDKPKWYALTMLPYPSGDLHTGHWYAFTPSDAGARFRRMNGYNVFFPIGFDAFGLPAENAAIKNGAHPARWTFANIDRMRQQLRRMGAMWSWEHEAVSADPFTVRLRVCADAVSNGSEPLASTANPDRPCTCPLRRAL